MPLFPWPPGGFHAISPREEACPVDPAHGVLVWDENGIYRCADCRATFIHADEEGPVFPLDIEIK